MKKILLIFLIIIAILVVVVLVIRRGSLKEVPKVFREFSIQLSDKPILDKVVGINVNLNKQLGGSQPGPLTQAKLKLCIPEGFEFVGIPTDAWEGNLIWEFDYETRERIESEFVTLENKIRAVKEGYWVIEAIAFYKDPDNNLQYTPLESRYLFIYITSDDAAIMTTEEASELKKQRYLSGKKPANPFVYPENCI